VQIEVIFAAPFAEDLMSEVHLPIRYGCNAKVENTDETWYCHMNLVNGLL
jgi:hypothetical protein